MKPICIVHVKNLQIYEIMKKKVLILIIGFALFAIAIGTNLQKEEKNIEAKNIDALAQEVAESLDYAYDCQRCKSADDSCYILGKLKSGWTCYL